MCILDSGITGINGVPNAPTPTRRPGSHRRLRRCPHADAAENPGSDPDRPCRGARHHLPASPEVRARRKPCLGFDAGSGCQAPRLPRGLPGRRGARWFPHRRHPADHAGLSRRHRPAARLHLDRGCRLAQRSRHRGTGSVRPGSAPSDSGSLSTLSDPGQTLATRPRTSRF